MAWDLCLLDMILSASMRSNEVTRVKPNARRAGRLDNHQEYQGWRVSKSG
jgi:hypothetical protein